MAISSHKVREHEDAMASRVTGIGPSPRLLMLCFLPLAILVIAMGIDQYVRQRAALLTDLAGEANERHGLISGSIAGAGPQLTALRLTLGVDDYKPPIGTVGMTDASATRRPSIPSSRRGTTIGFSSPSPPAAR